MIKLNLIVGTAMLCLVGTTSANTLTMPILGNVDGDTIATRIDTLPCPLCRVSVRIRGIDTPEKGSRAKCLQEAAKAVDASQFTRSLVTGASTMTVSNLSWDKYGGRINGDVTINGRDVGQQLIEQGFAKPYTGRGPKPDWCK